MTAGHYVQLRTTEAGARLPTTIMVRDNTVRQHLGTHTFTSRDNTGDLQPFLQPRGTGASQTQRSRHRRHALIKKRNMMTTTTTKARTDMTERHVSNSAGTREAPVRDTHTEKRKTDGTADTVKIASPTNMYRQQASGPVARHVVTIDILLTGLRKTPLTDASGTNGTRRKSRLFRRFRRSLPVGLSEGVDTNALMLCYEFQTLIDINRGLFVEGTPNAQEQVESFVDVHEKGGSEGVGINAQIGRASCRERE